MNRSHAAPADLLAELVQAGLCSEFDACFARGLGRIADDSRTEVLLTAALAHRATRDGHTCLSLSRVMGIAEDAALGATLPAQLRLEEAIRTSTLFGEHGTQTPLVIDDSGMIYLRRYYALERSVAAQLGRRFSARAPDAVDQAWLTSAFEAHLRPQATQEQRHAVSLALQHNATLISGGPGTGKTSSIVDVLAVYAAYRTRLGQDAPQVLLLAPTGKAAARLGRAVPHYETATIHRALGARQGGKSFRYDANRPLVADMVVVDEASMVDLALMHALLEALPDHARLLLVGDPDQLSSVEAGCVFRDICAAAKQDGRLPATWLTEQHRYAQSRGIADLAQAVRDQDPDRAHSVLSNRSQEQVRMLPLSSADDVSTEARANFSALIDSGSREEALAGLGRNQLLCVHRSGPFSTRAFNDQAARYFGDLVPIIIERNRHELDLYNGDVGLLDRRTEEALFSDASSKVRTIARSLLPAHDLAFAITVHKSQGSEFDQVSIVLPPNDSPLLTRELLYTGLTRAKHRVTIVGSNAVLADAIRRDGTRQTGLMDALLAGD